MPYQYTEQSRDEYLTQGYTILRDLMPPTLIAELRLETDKAREIARRKDGTQAQRLQPVYAHEELNPRAFRDFLALPGLQTAVANILGPDHHQSDIMGVLLEPVAKAWCTSWHRDWGYNNPYVKLDPFFEAVRNLGMFNQLNAALYDDHSLWVVPNSHNRNDTAEETAAFPYPPTGPILPVHLTPTEREHICITYVRSMPGAIPVTLFSGDVAFYRACQWHIGNYVPYTRRATLHDGFYGPDDLAWQAQVRQWQQESTRF